MTADITIVGAGLCGTHHLHREAEDAIRAARVVFYSSYNVGIVEHLRALSPAAILRYAEEKEYAVGMYRPEMYRRMARAVLDEASAGPGVVMLGPGSAVVVDQVTQHVLDGARDAGLRVRIVPGVSSIESVLAEVGHDVANGLTIVLAQRLVLERIELDPTIASIVIQPAYFDTRFYVGAPRSLEGRFDLFAAQLGRSLSPEAPMALVITPTEPGGDASVLWLRLRNLAKLHAALSPRHTLFIPPERPAPIDEAFAARIESLDELRSRIELDPRGAIVQQARARKPDATPNDLPDGLRAESRELAARWRSRPR